MEPSPTPRPSAEEPPRLPVLDGVRGLAVALVLLHHFFHGFAPEGNVLDKAVFAVAGRCWMGVDLFFVLSGFLITGILFDAKGGSHYFRNFYARRTLRIFPLYYAVLAFFFLLGPQLSAPLAAYAKSSVGDQAWFWTYATNLKIADRGAWYPQLIPNVLWSLAIEEQFYLIWPAVVLACGRRRLIQVCVVLIAVALGVRLAIAWHPDYNKVTQFVFTFARMDALAVGALLALLARGSGGLGAWRKPALGIGCACLALGSYLTVQRGPQWEEAPIQALRFTAVGGVFAALLLEALRARPRAWIARLFCLAPLRVLGKYSYALYLLHGPVDAFYKSQWPPPEELVLFGSALPGMALYSACAAGTTLALSWGTWHLIETPFLRLKKHFPSGR